MSSTIVRRVLVAGTGQLGSRYLQGLAKFHEPLEIFAYDLATKSLEKARQRFKEVPQEVGHRVNFSNDLESLPKTIDLAIVSSTADARPELVQAIACQAEIRTWILEKVLAQSIKGLHLIETTIQAQTPSWVNTPRPIFPLYQQLKKRINGQTIHAQFRNVTGIASNAVHFVDLVARITGEKVLSIDTSGLSAWKPYVKRPWLFDVDGLLNISFSNNSTLIISGTAGVRSTGAINKIKVGSSENSETWDIDAAGGNAVSTHGNQINAIGFYYQSDMTPLLVDRIFTGQNPGLTSLTESLELYEPLLKALLNHWNQTMSMSNSVTKLPIS